MHRITALFVLGTLVFVGSAAAATEQVWIALHAGSQPGNIIADVVVEDTGDIILDFEIPGFLAGQTSNDLGAFTMIDITGCGLDTAAGKARLPVLRRAIEIPQGAVPRVETLERSTRTFDLTKMDLPKRVFPVQPPVEKLPGALEAAEFAYSPDFYGSTKPYPGFDVRIAEIGQMRGHRFAMLEIAPVIYRPAGGTLEVTTHIRLRVTFSGADWGRTAAVKERYASPGFDLAASKVLLNYQPSSTKAVPELPVGYLIITDADFYDAMQPLVDWKTSKGYHTTIIKTADIPGGATTTAIKAYIKDAWQSWDIPPTFVLLVGDVGDIPNWTGVGTDNPPTDLYYVTMTDPDFIPDIGIGRFSVTTPEQAAELVAKTIEYEKRLFSQTAWLEKAVFMASEDNYTITEGTHNYVISNYVDPAGFSYDKLYCHTYSATTQQVRDAFNNGRVLGIYSGHGATTYWADGPQFTQSDVSGLTNLDMYPFVQSYACYTGRYTETECFAETWIRKTDKAGLAFLGSSVTSYWDEDDVLEKGVFRALFDDGLTWVSGMLDQGKWYLYEYYSGGGDTQRYYEMYNILGDPSVDIWTTYPATMAVTHLGVCPVGAGTYSVKVEDAKGPVADALACVVMPGHVYESAYTDASGDANLVLDPSPSEVGKMSLTITCHNFEPFVDTVDVVVPAIVTIDPDTIQVETATPVTVTVLDTLYQPMDSVVVTVDGWGIHPPLVDTTDATGQSVITVNAPYGETLTVRGREIGKTYDCFTEPLVVAGAVALPDPSVEAGVDELGLVGALTLFYEGRIVGRASHSGLDIYAVGCGLDESVSSPADSAVIEAKPTSLGTIAVALTSPGYEVFLDEFPVIEAYAMLAGTVTDVSSGDSLAGVAVSVYTGGADTSAAEPVFETTSGLDGSYSATDSLPVGTYDIYAKMFGYLDFKGSTMVYWGGNTYNIEMAPAPAGIVSGTVTETGTGRPITATIKIYRADDFSLFSETESDSLSGGAYATDPLPYFAYLFRVSAPHFMTENVYITVDEASEAFNFQMTPTQGNLLVIDDYTGAMSFASKRGPKGEVIAFAGVPEKDKNDIKSASLIAQDLDDLGYDVTTETSAVTNPATWPNYDVVIWSSGDDTSPVSVAAYRSSLNAYVAGGGKLLIEGGEIGYDAASYPNYPNFADTTLHVVDWEHDSSGNLSLALPTHPIATTPNGLPSTLAMTYSNYGDQDALIPDAQTQILFTWSSYPGLGGLLVYDDNPDPISSQIVFYAFDYANVTDTAARRDLLENTIAHLLAEESQPNGSIRGYVDLSGEASYEGAIVTTSPMGLTDTTDAAGSYSISGLYNGAYLVTAWKPGFTDSAVSVEIIGGGVENVDFTLYPVLEYMDDPEVPIPDDDSTGIRAYLYVPADAEIASVDCYVDLTHPFKGDLIIDLTSPEGTTVCLHNRTGGSADDIATWYDLETEPDGPGSMADFAGEWAQGTWELWIRDVASRDSGTVHTWGLRLAFPPSAAGTDVATLIPGSHFLVQNCPNPFGQATRLQFGLPRAEDVDLAIYDVQGRRVAVLASGRFDAGIYTLRWDGISTSGKPVASGIYFCRLRAGDFNANKTMVLMR